MEMEAGQARQRFDARRIERLRARVRAIERGGGGRGAGACADGAEPVLPLGLPSIDGALGGGLALARLHEIAGDPGPASAFAALLAARLNERDGRTALWIAPAPELFGPGLAQLGLTPERLMVVVARRPRDRLWALEEALRSGAVSAALAEVETIDLTASRRLQLAAEAGGTTALLVRIAGAAAFAQGGPIAASSRWRVAALASRVAGDPAAEWVGPARWRLDLLRARSGRTGSWTVERVDETGHGLREVGEGADLRQHPPALPPRTIQGAAPSDVVRFRRAAGRFA